ncbi:MAG: TonB-dependent receptor [Xanthomonadales bacterium]|nr:TonB-dependent receptor [Xanthomonadales bacterium]OJY86583.1 MAG: TonB-dependent receptor [Xanthomonadales bacterium 66-474]
MSKNPLQRAIQQALSISGVVGAGLALGCIAFPAVAQNTTPAGKQQPQTLQTIVVTGSHIRRVDLETSNPVVAVSAQQIASTGALTLGDVIQNLPVMSGSVTNGRVNNGGGAGQSLIGLRGLGPGRTLVLIDGQRVADFAGSVTAGTGVDLNTIPAAAVERIEVLTDGASAVYGSDAIGGVINIILKSNYQGAQFQANYGISDHDDGERRGASFMFGQSSDKGSILAGVDYNKFDEVLQASRSWSKNALSLSATNTSKSVALPGSGVAVVPGGSSYASRDRIFLPGPLGCGSLSLNESAATAGTSPTTLADYHCFTAADKYNYASVNLLMTPQERTNVFFKGVYHFSDNVDFYATMYHNKTDAASQLAPAVFGSGSNGFDTGFTISKNNYYNPFGVDFSTNGAAYAARNFPAGNRFFANTTTTDQLISGFKGNFNLFNQDWTWNAGYNYGHISQINTNFGLPNQTLLNEEAGPSFLNPDGVVQCGTPAAPISLGTCTPFDPFNLFSANSRAVIAAASTPAMINTWSIVRLMHADVSGGLFDLPAGTVQLAAGADYRKEYTSNTVSSGLLINPAANYTCTLSSNCTAHLQGGYNVKEAYAEVFIPVLKDLPFVRALNVTLGDRYSKYSDFGSTSNWKIAVEYRPIQDLLLRGTVQKVFRAPTLEDVFQAPNASAPLLSSDPCDHITTANPACPNVPLDGSFVDTLVASGQQIRAITAGSAYAGFHIGPESGKSFDLGAVYSPHYVPGLSLSADLWRIFLNNIVATVGAQSVLNLCFYGQTQFCPFITRSDVAGTLGQPKLFTLPTANLGRFDVKGLDVSADYKLPQFSFGQFNVGLNATYMKQAKVQSAPGQVGNSVLNYVGVMGSTGSSLNSSCPSAAGVAGGLGAICFFPRIRAQGTLGWQLGPWDAHWTMQYISHFKVGSYDPSQGATAATGFNPKGPAGPYVLHYGAYVYNNFTVGYNIDPINTRIDVGVDNVMDKQPPLLYANNSQNANTDPNDFDTLGRYYWARVTVKF